VSVNSASTLPDAGLTTSVSSGLLPPNAAVKANDLLSIIVPFNEQFVPLKPHPVNTKCSALPPLGAAMLAPFNSTPVHRIVVPPVHSNLTSSTIFVAGANDADPTNSLPPTRHAAAEAPPAATALNAITTTNPAITAFILDLINNTHAFLVRLIQYRDPAQNRKTRPRHRSCCTARPSGWQYRSPSRPNAHFGISAHDAAFFARPGACARNPRATCTPVGVSVHAFASPRA
jgi:hypothetical protein